MTKHIYNFGRPMTNTKQTFLNFKDNLLAIGESKEYIVLIGLDGEYRPVFDHVEKVKEEVRKDYRPEIFFKKLSANNCSRCVVAFCHKSNRLKAIKNDRELIENMFKLANSYGVRILDNIIINSDLTSYSSVL